MTTPPPLREVTPEERQRTARTFVLILLAFFGGIGVMVAVLSIQGRAAREYGQMVLAAAPQPLPAKPLPCAQVLPDKAVPPNIESCTLQTEGGKALVVVQVEGDKQYQVR